MWKPFQKHSPHNSSLTKRWNQGDTSARYVFKEETIMSYLEKHPAYSSYVDILRQVNISKLSDSKVSQLLSARGVYTVFAPNNEAIQKYLEDLTEEGLSPHWMMSFRSGTESRGRLPTSSPSMRMSRRGE